MEIKLIELSEKVNKSLRELLLVHDELSVLVKNESDEAKVFEIVENSPRLQEIKIEFEELTEKLGL